MSFHEDLSRGEDMAGGSDRSFGLVMAGAFALYGLGPLVRGNPLRLWALAVAILFAVLAMALPRVLAPLNKAWIALGRLLNRIVSPVVMSLLFGVVVVPTGIVLRLTGKDPLRLKLDRAAPSYWQMRNPPGPAPGSLKQQF
jgi:hypothetical protein